MPDTAARTGPDDPRTGAMVSARAALVAGRVADLLASHCSAAGGTAEIDFLREWAAAALGGGTTRHQDHPLERLTNTFALTDGDQDLLVLAGLPEEHEGLASTFRAMHPRGEPRPTAGLAALLLGDGSADRPTVRRLLLMGSAVRNRLVHVVDGIPLFERGLVPADGLWDVLHGFDAWPTGLERLPVGAVPAGLDQWSAQPVVQRAVRALEVGERVSVIVGSPDPGIGLGRCAAIAAAARVPLVAARAEPGDPAAIGLLAAHAAARGAVPVVVVGAPADPGAQVPVVAVSDLPGPVLICTAQGGVRAGTGRAVLTLPIGPIGTADHRVAWRAALPELGAQAPALAARHPLDPTLIAQVAIDAAAHDRLGSPVACVADVSDLVRARAGVMLPTGIELATPAVPWTRLVLTAEAASQLRDAVSRLEHQSLVLDDWGMRDRARASRGIRLLLTGPPGTGKSLAAEAVATATGTDLLVVDTSQVVSKWIGETEKNLAAAFDVAERTQAVLLLDEADALFGSRTEISDAHDRYANLETAYLLQRLDRFDGLAVLATNLRHNIDPAFIRRMDFVVEFPLPGAPARRDLWLLHLPADRLAADVDVDLLARRYPVAGGWIRNAAVGASFVAAAEGAEVGRHHLLAALRREYAKAALPFPCHSARRRDDHV